MSIRVKIILFPDGSQSSKNIVLCSIKIKLNKRTRGYGRDYVECPQYHIAKLQTGRTNKPSTTAKSQLASKSLLVSGPEPITILPLPANIWPSLEFTLGDVPSTDSERTTNKPHTIVEPQPNLEPEPILPQPVKMWPNLEQAVSFTLPVSDADTNNSEDSAEFEWGGKKLEKYPVRADMKRKRNKPDDGSGADDNDVDDNDLGQTAPVGETEKSEEFDWGRGKLEEYKKSAIPDELRKRNVPDASASDDTPSVVNEGQIPVAYIKEELDNDDADMQPNDNVGSRSTKVFGGKTVKTETGLKTKDLPPEHLRPDKFHEYLYTPQQCKVCNEEFANMYLFQVHLDNTHFWCEKCKIMLKTKFQWTKHQAPWNVKCTECDKVFCTAPHQKEHYNKVHYFPSQCDICHVKFNSKLVLEEHKVQAFKCQECEQQFCFKKAYAHHIVNGHRQKCSQCPCTFATEAQLERHMGRHNYIECDICGKMSKGRENLKAHKRQVHGGGGYIPCDICGKLYKSIKSVEEHKVIDHGAEGKFKCDECGKQFLTKQRFDKHVRVHTGEKPYECITCGRAFSDQSTLHIHSKLHTNDRPFKCTKCDAAYTTRRYLKDHMEKHDPSKAVRCEICFKMFRSKGLLKVHSEIHMNRRKYKCDICGTAYNNHGSLYTHKKKHKERGEMS